MKKSYATRAEPITKCSGAVLFFKNKTENHPTVLLTAIVYNVIIL